MANQEDEAKALAALKPQRIIVSQRSWNALQKILRDPPKPNPLLRALMQKKAPWERS